MNKAYGVILGLAGPNPLGVARALSSEDIPVIGMAIESEKPASAYSKSFKETKILRNESELFKSLISLSHDFQSKGVLFPTGDDYIVFCSKYKEDLKPHYHVPSVEGKKLEDLLDKNVNNSFGLDAGFKIPFSIYLSNFEGDFEGPLIAKPLTSVGTSKRDMTVYKNPSELLRDKKDLLKKFGDMAVQEFIPGDNTSLFEVHAYKNSSGVIIGGMQRNIFAREMSPSVYGGVVFESVWIPELVKPSKKLMTNLQFNGPVDINLKKSDLNGEFYFIEFNPRTSANLSLDTATGQNLPLIVYNDLTTGKPHGSTEKKNKTGTYWLWERALDKYAIQNKDFKKILDTIKGHNIIRALHIEGDQLPYEKENIRTETREILKSI